MNQRSHSISISSFGRTLVSIGDFSFTENGITFLFGESGIGKSLLCKAVYGLLDSQNLDVTMDGKPYQSYINGEWSRQVRQSSFFVFQEPSSHLNPLMLIGEQLNEGSLGKADNEREVLARLWQNSDEKAIRAILDVYPKPYRPSGGEKQRVLLAMAFKKTGLLAARRSAGLQPPTFFVFDEPTGSLDNNYRNHFLSLLLEKYAQTPFSAVIITHDYSVISEIYRNHRRFLNSISFRELSRVADAEVRLTDFSADEYLGWLGREAAARKGTDRRDDIVLSMEPSLRIFNRHLGIFSDPGRTIPAPLVIHKGEVAYVKAPSGMGKTTIAKVIMGLYHADEFAMTLCGIRVTQKTHSRVWLKEIWGRRAGMVFQHADEALDLESTVPETFAGLRRGMRMGEKQVAERMAELFDPTMVSRLMDRKVKYLSGGQKQRLNLLRSLILDTDLTILDEPLNALDFDSVRKVLALLEQKRRAGGAFLMISHNEEIFDAVVDSGSVYYLGEQR